MWIFLYSCDFQTTKSHFHFMKLQWYFMSAIWIYSYAYQVSFVIFILHWEWKLTNLFCVFQEICCLESLSASFLDIQPTFNDKFHILQAFYCLKNSPIQYTIYLVCWYSYLRYRIKTLEITLHLRGKDYLLISMEMQTLIKGLFGFNYTYPIGT